MTPGLCIRGGICWVSSSQWGHSAWERAGGPRSVWKGTEIGTLLKGGGELFLFKFVCSELLAGPGEAGQGHQGPRRLPDGLPWTGACAVSVLGACGHDG